MDIKPILRDLRQTATGCRAVAFADLSTNMVLASETEISVVQEYWDALASKAKDLLTGPTAEAVSGLIGATQSAVLRRGDDQYLLIRSRSDPPLGLLFICDAAADISPFIDVSHGTLELLAAND